MELKLFKKRDKNCIQSNSVENNDVKKHYYSISDEEVDNYAAGLNNDLKVAHFTHTDIAGKACALLAKRTFANIDTFYCSNKDVDDIINTFIIIDRKFVDYDIILVSDVSLNKGTLLNLNNVQTKTNEKVKCMYITHQSIYLEDAEKYPWITCMPQYTDSTGNIIKQSAACILYRMLTEDYSLKADAWLDEFIEKGRRYTTWDWFEMNDLDARGLSMLCHDTGHKYFVKQLIKKHLSNDSLLNEEDIDKLEYLEEKYQEYKEQKINEVILCRVSGYKTATVMAELFIDRLCADIAYHYKNLDEVIIINSFVKANFRATHGSNMDINDVAKIFGANSSGNKKAAGATIPVEVREAIVKKFLDLSQERYNKNV